MKCLRYIVLMVSVLLVVACEQLPLPDTELILAKQGTVELTDNSAVIEIEFHPTAATIQTVTACYTGGLKKEMTHVKGLVYRVELKNLQSDTEYHVYYEVSNVFSTVVVTGNYSFITAKKGEKPNPTVTPEYVDLGLPSGVKWATFNVGATKPEEYGDYFAWGETEPKELYDWSTYKWCDGSYNTLTKYNTDSEYGVVDNKKILESSDDAAYVNWGGNWRMPSTEEWNELFSNSSLKWEERNGVSGVTLVSVQNGNSLFLPAAGVYHYNNGLISQNTEGYYRTNSLDESRGTISLGFSSNGSINWYANDRCFGQPVRPVYGSRAEETTVPTVVTSAVTQITETTAVAGGNVTSNGGASVTERGVVYSTNPNPVITNLSNTIRPCGSGAGEFTYTITGLQPATTYYVRAYARNDQGTAYGEEVSFTTETTLPTVVTSAVTQITETSAVVGGNVTSDGGASVTERGVVYSTNPNPVITNLSNTIRPCGSGTGEFTYTITGLQPATTYYVRAYARNDQGTAYGEEVSFTTQIQKPTSPYFSVSQTKYITFSPGNLQYTQSTNTWSFAENQWDMIGTDNVTGGSVSSDSKKGDHKEGTALADKVDLFGWSTSATNFGVSTSEDYNDYSGTFVDRGTNTIGNDAPNTWRTLTNNEWEYLLNTRPNASSLKGVAQVNGVNGLIFLPDNWTCPSGVTFKSGFHSEQSVEAYSQYQAFSADQWSKLEDAGAVFLPAAGDRPGSDVVNVQRLGCYWSATEYLSDYAKTLDFYSDEAYMSFLPRFIGFSVRLVKDL